VPTIKAGVDVELDFEPEWFTPERIHMFLDSGDLTENQLDEMLYNRFLKMFEFGQFEDPFLQFTHADLTANGQEGRKIAENGAVLLKNEGGMLPLGSDVGSIALIGPKEFAGKAKLPPRSGTDIGETVVTPYTVTPQKGLENVIGDLGYNTKVTYNDGTDISSAAELAANSDVVLLMVGDLAQETQDKTNLKFPELSGVDQEALLNAVVGVNPNTVVVLKTTGMMLMPWLDKVPALLEAWYPGQDDGNVVADLLYGKVNPSGKLPVTFGNTEHEAAWATQRQYPGVRVDTGKIGGPGPNGEPGVDQLHFFYDEDLQMGYRWYEANKVQPMFPFGYGLSYTTFEYSGLAVTPTLGVTGERALKVDFTVTNTGDVAGAEAAQVYLTLPAAANEPSKRLVAFDKPYLEPGASKQVSVMIDASAASHPFSYWVPDTKGTWADGDWATAPGSYTVHVGPSSAETPLEAAVTLDFPAAQNTGDVPVAAEVPDVTLEPGMLTMRIGQFDGLVDLVGQHNVDRWRFDGDLPTIAVTDTRSQTQAADGGWSVTGRAADFVSGNDSFGAEHLGWIPWTTASGRPGVTAGPEVKGVMRGGPGLADPATLVSATAAGRYGSATAGAHLLLEVPLNTTPGDYRSVVTLTLFPED
jgi:beta-glucosidase